MDLLGDVRKGEPVYHVGSPRGVIGANSVTDGVISGIGRMMDGLLGEVFDQVSSPGWFGSSGGGVFRKSDGLLVGIVVRGFDNTTVFTVPSRRILEWARDAGVEWVVNPTIKVPNEVKPLEVEAPPEPEPEPEIELEPIEG